MNLDKNLVKKYVFYNSYLLNEEMKIGLAFLNLCLQIYGIFIYKTIVFCAIIGVTIVANIIFLIVSLLYKKKFNKFLYFALEMAITFVLLNCINFAHMKYYHFYKVSKFLLGVLSEIIMLLPAFQLNKYMLLKMDKWYDKKKKLMESIVFLGSGLGVAVAKIIKNVLSDSQLMLSVYYMIIILVYLCSIIEVGFFYKVYLIKKYQLNVFL